MILTKLLFEQFCTLSYFTIWPILIVHSVLYISFPYVYTLVYRSSFTGACCCLWGCSCTLSSGSLVCTFLCVPCGTYGLRCSLLQWYTTLSLVQTLYDQWPRYSWIMAGCHLFLVELWTWHESLVAGCCHVELAHFYSAVSALWNPLWVSSPTKVSQLMVFSHVEA